MSDFAKVRIDSAVESVLGQRDDPKAWAKRLRGMYHTGKDADVYSFCQKTLRCLQSYVIT